MSYRTEILGLLRVAPQGATYNEAESFEAVQRARFLFVNIIGVLVAFTVLGADLIRQAHLPIANNIMVSFFAAAYHVAFIYLAYQVKNIEHLCRIFMILCSISLWLDITSSGGISTPWATMYVLLPIGAGLLLGLRDVLIFTLLTAVMVISTGYMSIMSAPIEQHAPLLLETVFLVVGAIVSGVSVIVLVAHYYKVDMNRQVLLRSKEFLARHDGLTGLANRSVVTEELSSLSLRQKNANLFLADLDDFKEVNDAYGHPVGDKLLVQIADRLRALAPEGAVVARLGGDEFLLLADADEAGKTIGWPVNHCLGKEIVARLSEPFCLDGLTLKMSGSVGVAHFPEEANTGEELLQKADLALYAAKAAGRNQCFRFESKMEEAQDRRLTLQQRLRAAVEQEDIYLGYQPQFCLQTNCLMGFEALARWNDAELGVVDPETFIQIAEDCGLIEQLGEQLLRHACVQALDWPKLEGASAPLKVSVNISTLQLKADNIVQTVSDILCETGFPANRLELEVTESVLIANPKEVARKLNDLATLGVDIAMDDFGKGYSSLSYLQHFALSRLKIDRSFVANLAEPNGKPIVSAIIRLAQAMDLNVVAEGVETDAQRRALKSMGCDYAQGYFYAPSLCPADALKLIVTSAARSGHGKKAKLDMPSENAIKSN